jgi:hypothetical protein
VFRLGDTHHNDGSTDPVLNFIPDVLLNEMPFFALLEGRAGNVRPLSLLEAALGLWKLPQDRECRLCSVENGTGSRSRLEDWPQARLLLVFEQRSIPIADSIEGDDVCTCFADLLPVGGVTGGSMHLCGDVGLLGGLD